jgi:O6-methylguanine-DNA--protein-cysteine methyltransferase
MTDKNRRIIEEYNSINYGRLMSYAEKFRSSGKKTEAKKVHQKAQQLNRYFYSAVHTDDAELVVYYSKQMSLLVSNTNAFIENVLVDI